MQFERPPSIPLNRITDEKMLDLQSDFAKSNPDHFVHNKHVTARTSSLRRSFKLKLPGHEWDQKRTGFCTGYAVAMTMEITNNHQHPKINHRYDPIFVYYNEYQMPDGPASTKSALDVAKYFGMVRGNGVAPKNSRKYHYKPPKWSSKNKREGIKNYWPGKVATVFDIWAIKYQLLSGVAVPFDINCFKSPDMFLYRNEAWWNYPAGKLDNGHAMCIFGYDDRRQAFAVKNSWGNYYSRTNFGKGTVWMRYGVLLNGRMDANYFLITDK